MNPKEEKIATKKITMENSIYSVNLINFGKSALIAEQNGR